MDGIMINDFPRRVEIEPTNECNRFCSYCPRKYMKGKPGFMDYGLFKKLLDEIGGHKDIALALFRRGEALLHPQFKDMVAYSRDKVAEIQLATNATLLDKGMSDFLIGHNVDFISFSLDPRRTYSKNRGGTYDTVLGNVLYFLGKASSSRTQVSMVKTDTCTQGDVDEFRAFWTKQKVDRVRIYEEHTKNGKFGSLSSGRGKRKTCVKPFNDMLIFWDGKVGRCNHDWGGCSMGDVAVFSIKEVWRSDMYEKLRDEHISLCLKDIICSRCDSWQTDPKGSDVGSVLEK